MRIQAQRNAGHFLLGARQIADKASATAIKSSTSADKDASACACREEWRKDMPGMARRTASLPLPDHSRICGRRKRKNKFFFADSRDNHGLCEARAPGIRSMRKQALLIGIPQNVKRQRVSPMAFSKPASSNGAGSENAMGLDSSGASIRKMRGFRNSGDVPVNSCHLAGTPSVSSAKSPQSAPVPPRSTQALQRRAGFRGSAPGGSRQSAPM